MSDVCADCQADVPGNKCPECGRGTIVNGELLEECRLLHDKIATATPCAACFEATAGQQGAVGSCPWCMAFYSFAMAQRRVASADKLRQASAAYARGVKDGAIKALEKALEGPP